MDSFAYFGKTLFRLRTGNVPGSEFAYKTGNLSPYRYIHCSNKSEVDSSFKLFWLEPSASWWLWLLTGVLFSSIPFLAVAGPSFLQNAAILVLASVWVFLWVKIVKIYRLHALLRAYPKYWYESPPHQRIQRLTLWLLSVSASLVATVISSQLMHRINFDSSPNILIAFGTIAVLGAFLVSARSNWTQRLRVPSIAALYNDDTIPCNYQDLIFASANEDLIPPDCWRSRQDFTQYLHMWAYSSTFFNPARKGYVLNIRPAFFNWLLLPGLFSLYVLVVFTFVIGWIDGSKEGHNILLVFSVVSWAGFFINYYISLGRRQLRLLYLSKTTNSDAVQFGGINMADLGSQPEVELYFKGKGLLAVELVVLGIIPLYATILSIVNHF